MITAAQYFWQKEGNAECTPAICAAADLLLMRVNALLAAAARLSRWKEQVDPDTGSPISGARGGAGDGGFRLAASTTGMKKSAHKLGRGIDVYDPDNALDEWLSQHDRDDGRLNTMLAEYGLYREAPDKTPGWCHLQDISPGSGRRTFIPF